MVCKRWLVYRRDALKKQVGVRGEVLVRGCYNCSLRQIGRIDERAVIFVVLLCEGTVTCHVSSASLATTVQQPAILFPVL